MFISGAFQLNYFVLQNIHSDKNRATFNFLHVYHYMVLGMLASEEFFGSIQLKRSYFTQKGKLAHAT